MSDKKARPPDVVTAIGMMADYLDAVDRLISQMSASRGRPVTLASDVQRDLRRMANWYREHPGQAKEIWDYVGSHDAAIG